LPVRPASVAPCTVPELAELMGAAALPGARAHGADFAAEALANGAVAVMTDEVGATRAALASVPVLVHQDPRSVLGTVSAHLYGDPSARLPVLGITGTSGKTTTAYLVEAGLRAAGEVAGCSPHPRRLSCRRRWP